jgi:O-antigen ligase/tetratricopeptide (TPR) repeat protein
MPARAFQWQLVAWLGIAVLSAYCLFWGGAWVATYYADLRIWALIPAFAVVAVWVVVAWRDPFWRPRSVLGPAFAAAFAAFAISTVASRSPRFSVEYLALAVLLASLYLILQRLMASSYFRPRMMGFAVLAAVLLGSAYVAVTVSRWIVWWDTIGRFAAPPLRPFFEGLTLGNPSAVMTASVLLTAPAVAHLAGGSTLSRAGAAVLVALAGMATVISGSRAGWLAIGIAVATVGALWLIAPERRAALIAVARSRTGRLAAVALGAVGLVAAVVVAPGFLLRATAGGEGLRATYWAAAVRMFESSPLVGTGPGTWVPQRVSYTLADEPDYYIPHAHNLYVQTAAEFGMVGLLAGVAVAVLLGRLLVEAIRDPEPARRRMGWAALFATVYFAAHQLLDFYANAPAILFSFAIPIAWLDATSPIRTPGPPRMFTWAGDAVSRSSRAMSVGGVVVLVASACFLAWSEAGALQLSQGTRLLDAGQPAAAVEPLTNAVRHDPAMTPYHLELGIALADTGDLDGAEAQLATAAAADGLPEAWLNLAAVQTQLGERQAAREALRQALRLGDQQVGVLIAAGEVYLQLGDADAAVTAFADGLLSSPTLAGDPWWTAAPERSAVWPAVYQLAFDRAGASSQLVLALQTGDEAAAATVIGALDDDTATTSRLAQRAWTGDAPALDELEARARERPLDVAVVNWCAMLHRRAGHPELAAAYVAWADTINGDARLGGYETRVTTTTKPARIAGLSTLYYGHYTYRRPVSDYQLVDWLPELGYE